MRRLAATSWISLGLLLELPAALVALDPERRRAKQEGRNRAVSAASGFSLIEVLVALTVLAVVLLVAGGFFWQQYRISERLDASRHADAELENAYEELRAGVLPLVSGPVLTSDDSLQLTALVGPTSTPFLAQLTLTASYELRGQRRERRLQALVFAP